MKFSALLVLVVLVAAAHAHCGCKKPAPAPRYSCDASQLEQYCPPCAPGCLLQCGCLFPGTGEVISPRTVYPERPVYCSLCVHCLAIRVCDDPLPTCTPQQIRDLISAGSPPTPTDDQ